MTKYLNFALAKTKHFGAGFGEKTLRDFQLLSARYFLGLENTKGMLLFQDTGFGKTLTSVYMLHKLKEVYPHWRILILCKASLVVRPWGSTLAEYMQSLENVSIMAYDDPTFANKFFSHTKGITQKERVFVIIDECHNFISRNLAKDGVQRKMKRVYNELIKLVHDPHKKNKIMLLSASPLVNDAMEFFLLVELLRPGVMTQDVTLFQDNILIFKDELIRGLQGICSVKRNKCHGIFDNIPVSDSFAARNIKHITCEMSVQQEDIYNKAEKYEREKGLAAFKSNRRMVSSFGYKELVVRGDMSEREFEDYIENVRVSIHMEFDPTVPGRGFTEEGLDILGKGDSTELSINDLNIYNTLYGYSAKFTKTCHMILQSPGKCLIFEPFVNNSGISILVEYLRVFNIKYIEFSGRTRNIRDKHLDLFNEPSNINGKNIKACVFSNSGAEGVSYTGINDIYILDLTWNEATLKQIMGRAIRMASHVMLPIERQYTNVNFMITTRKRGTSVDQELLELIKGKSRQIDQLFEVFRQTSIEYIFENDTSSGMIPETEDILAMYLSEKIKFDQKVYQKEFARVLTVYYSFDTILKNIFVGYIGEDKSLYSEDGNCIGQVTDKTIIKIKDKKLIYVML